MFNYKSLTDTELTEIYQGHKFDIVPRRHQLISLIFATGEDLKRLVYWHGIGTGKTISALMTTQEWGCKKILIVAASSCWEAWERDIPRFGCSFKFLTGSGKQRKQTLKRTRRDVYIITYDGLKTIYAHLEHKKKGKGWIIDNNSFIDEFDCIILDEVHRCNAPNSLQSKISYELSRRAKYCIGLTGTLIDKHILELFNIYKTIDLGKTLGTNFFVYRNTYFIPPKEWEYTWRPKPGARETILNRISRCTMFFERKECLDLPESETIEKKIKPTKEFSKIQDELIVKGRTTIQGTEIECKKPAAIGSKLRQLPGGFIYLREDEEQTAYRLKKNPKLNTLIELIEGTNSKIIVTHNYTEEALMIEESLQRNKIDFLAIRGGVKEQQKEIIAQFRKDNNIQILLIYPKCASEGFDATVADIMIFYSQIASPRLRQQCEGRIHRGGQDNKCLFIDLIMESSIDSTTKKNLKTNKSMVDLVKEYIQNYG